MFQRFFPMCQRCPTSGKLAKVAPSFHSWHDITSDGKRSQNSFFSSEGFNGQGYILWIDTLGYLDSNCSTFRFSFLLVPGFKNSPSSCQRCYSCGLLIIVFILKISALMFSMSLLISGKIHKCRSDLFLGGRMSQCFPSRQSRLSRKCGNPCKPSCSPPWCLGITQV